MMTSYQKEQIINAFKAGSPMITLPPMTAAITAKHGERIRSKRIKNNVRLHKNIAVVFIYYTNHQIHETKYDEAMEMQYYSQY